MNSEHTHCWHQRGAWVDAAGRHESRQCCHCGAFETVDIPAPTFTPTTAPQRWVQPQHGPHQPPDMVRW